MKKRKFFRFQNSDFGPRVRVRLGRSAVWSVVFEGSFE